MLPRDVTKPSPFKLSQSNIGSVVKREEYKGREAFDTFLEPVQPHQEWPTGSQEKQSKRRSVSQQFTRNFNTGDIESDGTYRVTFMNKPGMELVPYRSDERSKLRCEQTHPCLLEKIEERPTMFKALPKPNFKPFVLK